MRKLIWLAVALGAVELARREASKRGLMPSAFLSRIATGIAALLTGQAPSA